MTVHGPSLGLGAAVAAASIIASFAAFNAVSDGGGDGLVFEQPPGPRQPPPAGGGPAVPTQAVPTSALLANGSPPLGDPGAPVTLVEFGDYQCHFCGVFFRETEPTIVENYVRTGKVKMIFKDYTIIGPDSIGAAHAAHCAREQGMFWEYHDALYAAWTGENNGWAAPENLLVLARQTGLDIPSFDGCMGEARHSAAIEKSNADAAALRLGGTPAFFVIGSDGDVTALTGAQPYEVFARIFDSKLEG